MAVKLNVQANVTGQGQLAKLNMGLKSLGTQALIAKRKLARLEAGAARSRATMSTLATTLRVGVVAGFAAAGFAAASFVRSTFRAGNIMEKSRIQFNAFFGSAKKGGEAFKILNQYASKVPFSLDQIIQGSTALAAISKGPADLGKQLEIVGNLAAAANLSFADAALQYQKVASAGIAAADLLRDRGVKGILGFKEGMRYTAEESVRVFEKNFLNGGKFSKVAADLAGTLAGSVSMVQDFYFQINAAAAKPLFDGLTAQINELVGDFKKNDAQLKALGVQIGQSLAKGFANLGKFIRFVVDNFDKLVIGIKLFLTLKIIVFVNGVGMAFLLWAKRIKTVRRAFIALNLTMKANPIGMVVLALEGLFLAFIIFEEQLSKLARGPMVLFNQGLAYMQIGFLKFKNSLNIGEEDVNLAGIEKLKAEIDKLQLDFDKIKNPEISPDIVNADLLAYEKEVAEKAAELASQELKAAMEAARIVKKNSEDRINAVAFEAEWLKMEADIRLEGIKKYRDQLSAVGIESQAIATTIGDTWVNGLREGNSLLEITKDSFKNVLRMLAEQMLRKTIEYGVELLFVTLLGNKVDKEKQITAEKKKQFTWAALTAAISGSGSGSFFKFAEGGVVPGGAPYTDRVPAMLTPGEVVIPRDKVGQQSGNTNITNINISGNVDQRSIDQIKGVISSASAEVGGANKAYTRNTQGLRGRNI